MKAPEAVLEVGADAGVAAGQGGALVDVGVAVLACPARAAGTRVVIHPVSAPVRALSALRVARVPVHLAFVDVRLAVGAWKQGEWGDVQCNLVTNSTLYSATS